MDSGNNLNASQNGVGTSIGSAVYSFPSGTNSPLFAGSFLKIEMNGDFNAQGNHTGGGGTSSIGVQMGHSGTEPPNDIMTSRTVANAQTSSATDNDKDRDNQFTFYHLISGTDLTSGLDLTILLSASASVTALSAGYANRQTIFQVIQ